MKDVYIATQNYQRFSALCDELLSSAHGVELAAVIGHAGRGKTKAAKQIFSKNLNTVYCLYKEDDTHADLLREITFRLAGLRPGRKQHCYEIIERELAARRRVIMVDEADRMSLTCLNGLRNIHDICGVPIIMIGEEDLKSKLGRERRLVSRVRDVIQFEPVVQIDIVVYYRQSLDLALSPAQAAKLLRHCEGDFRLVLTDALAVERLMTVNNITTVTDAIVDEIMKRQVKEGGWAAR
jgi:hypothetical protein